MSITAPMPSRRRFAPLALAAVVFALALGPRLWRIDAHLTPDELRWVCRTVAFHAGVRTGDWALTLQTGHPGVVTMWLGGLGLPVSRTAAWSKACLESRSSELLYELPTADRTIILDRLYAGRSRIAVFTALIAALLVWLSGRLFGQRVALVAAPLVALDPFWLAHSRFLHLDGVLTGLMSIALLTLLIYLVGPVDGGPAGGGSPPRRGWLIASGVALGLALAAKSPALFLIGYGGVLWLAFARRRRTGFSSMVGQGALWLAVAALTIVAVWPALWVDPVAVLRLVGTDFTRHGTATLERASFFAGQIRDDAGPLFYATVWWLRTSPWVLAGVGIAAGLCGRDLVERWRGRGTHAPAAAPSRPATDGMVALRCLLAFGVLFTVFLTVASKEFDRYLLPAFPAADIVAAIGLVGAADWAVRRAGRGGRWARSAAWRAAPIMAAPITAAVVLATQMALVLPIGPYWVTWYDPLTGGAERAQRLLLVGWGEGLDQMAAYLNAQPDAARLEVASRYRAAFGLLFDGRNVQTEAYDPDTTDFIVFMLNQVQRHQDPELLAKFMGVDPPAASAVIGGIERGVTVAWAYRNRADEPVRAYLDAHADPATDALLVRDGHILTRRYAGPLAVVTLPSDRDATDGAAADAAADGSLRRTLAEAFSRHRRVWYVHRAEGERTAVDRSAARLLATSTRLVSSERLGDLVVDAYALADGPPPTFAAPPAVPIALAFGRLGDPYLTLSAIGLAPSPWPTDRAAPVDLTWRSAGADAPTITLSVQLLDGAGRPHAQLDVKLVDAAGRPTNAWRTGVDVHTSLAIDVPGQPAGEYTLSIGAYTARDDGWEGLAVLATDGLDGLGAAGHAARVEANRLLVPVRLGAPAR